MRKQISSNSCTDKNTKKLLTYTSYMYIYLNACKQMTDVKLLVTKKYLKSFNYLPKNSSGSFKCYLQNVFRNHIYLIYLYKQDLVLNNQQGLINPTNCKVDISLNKKT